MKTHIHIGILIATTLTASTVSAANINNADNNHTNQTQQDNALLKLEDVFSLEYASGTKISNDGEEVFFVRNYMDINRDKKLSNIWKVNNKKQLVPVTDGLNAEYSPTLSPDNTKLAYISTASGTPQVHMIWLGTGKSSQMSHLAQAPSNLSWSPDGTQLAFSLFVPQKPKSVIMLPGKPENAKWAEPAIYVDDMYYRRDGVGVNKPGHQHIFVMSADGGAPRQITFGQYDHTSNLSWSKDGQQIIYSTIIAMTMILNGLTVMCSV